MNTTSIGHIMELIQPFKTGVTVEDAREKVYWITRKIGDPKWTVPTKVLLKIENHTTPLPTRIIRLNDISKAILERPDYINPDEIVYTTQDMVNIRETEAFTLNTYKILTNNVYTDFLEGYIELNCNVMAVDEDGELLIPDDLDYLEAVKYSILAGQLEIEMFNGKNTAYNVFANKAAFYLQRCINAYKMPKLDYDTKIEKATVNAFLGSIGLKKSKSVKSANRVNRSLNTLHTVNGIPTYKL